MVSCFSFLSVFLAKKLKKKTGWILCFGKKVRELNNSIIPGYFPLQAFEHSKIYHVYVIPVNCIKPSPLSQKDLVCLVKKSFRQFFITNSFLQQNRLFQTYDHPNS